jgi:hypothetical protein
MLFSRPGIAKQFHVDISPVTAWQQDPNPSTDYKMSAEALWRRNPQMASMWRRCFDSMQVRPINQLLITCDDFLPQ